MSGPGWCVFGGEDPLLRRTVSPPNSRQHILAPPRTVTSGFPCRALPSSASGWVLVFWGMLSSPCRDGEQPNQTSLCGSNSLQPSSHQLLWFSWPVHSDKASVPPKQPKYLFCCLDAGWTLGDQTGCAGHTATLLVTTSSICHSAQTLGSSPLPREPPSIKSNI